MSTGGWTSIHIPQHLNKEELYSWCQTNFGPPGFLSDRRWTPLEFTFQFRDKEDAVWFKLKWGS